MGEEAREIGPALYLSEIPCSFGKFRIFPDKQGQFVVSGIRFNCLENFYDNLKLKED